MTKATSKLAKSIQAAKKANRTSDLAAVKKPQSGYGIAAEMLTDLIGCVIVAFAVGVFCQKMFGAPVYLTVGLTFLGGVAGLWTVVRTGIRLSKKGF